MFIIGLLFFISLSVADPTETFEPTPDDSDDSTTDKGINKFYYYEFI